MKLKLITLGLLSVILLILFSTNSFANKTSVKIIAPEKAEKGSEVTIKIEVMHKGNTKGHFTDWVKVKINGDEQKWEYSPKKLPDNQNFTVELTVKADKNLEIIAVGNCNRHGSKGKVKASVLVE